MKKLFAYAFESDLTLPAMFARLNAQGPWTWIERDSEHWGDYLSARALPDPDYAMVKLFAEPDHFGINSKFESAGPDADAQFAAFHDALMTKVLPALGARNVRATDTYD